jgi:hypothetical protein
MAKKPKCLPPYLQEALDTFTAAYGVQLPCDAGPEAVEDWCKVLELSRINHSVFGRSRNTQSLAELLENAA